MACWSSTRSSPATSWPVATTCSTFAARSATRCWRATSAWRRSHLESTESSGATKSFPPRARSWKHSKRAKISASFRPKSWPRHCRVPGSRGSRSGGITAGRRRTRIHSSSPSPRVQHPIFDPARPVASAATRYRRERLHRSRLTLYVQIGELLFQLIELGLVVDDDVHVRGMLRQIVLVVVLRRVERVERSDFGNNWPRERFGLLQLCDIGFRHALLFRIGVKNRRAILRSDVGALAVKLCRIMRDGEEYPQQLTVGDLRRIVDYLHRLGVPSRTGADELIARGLGRAAGIPRRGAGHSPDVLENRVHSREASAGEHRGCLALGGGLGQVRLRIRERSRDCREPDKRCDEAHGTGGQDRFPTMHTKHSNLLR